MEKWCFDIGFPNAVSAKGGSAREKNLSFINMPLAITTTTNSYSNTLYL
jgi:hypothetical protein